RALEGGFGMRLLAIACVLMTAACTTGPNIGANVGISPGGVTVNPSVSGRVGNVGVSVTP
ncbi:MAG: hypothetical protein AAFY90_10585, partial [Pseudomonadota bacterium]